MQLRRLIMVDNELNGFRSQEEKDEADKFNAGANGVPVPGGHVPETRLWTTKVDSKTMQDVSYRDPQGNFHKLEDGQKFAIERDHENNKYTAVVTDVDGKRTIAENGKIFPSNEVAEPLPYDKDRLNAIVHLAAKPNSLWAKNSNSAMKIEQS